MDQDRIEQSAEIEALLLQGQQLLKGQRWDQAAAQFARVLELAPDRAEAYVGRMLARANAASLPELCRILPARFRSEPLQWFPAMQPDTARIEDAVRRWAVPGRISPAEIRREYAFDFLYPSRVEAAKDNHRQMLRYFESDRDLALARQYAGPELLQELDGMRSTVLAAYDARVAKAKKDASLARKIVMDDYGRHLISAEAAVARRAGQAAYPGAEQAVYSGAGQAVYPGAGQAAQVPPVRQPPLSPMEATPVPGWTEEPEMTPRVVPAGSRKKKAFVITVVSVVLVAALAVLAATLLAPALKYSRANRLMKEGEWSEAASLFSELGDYRDSRQRCKEAKENVKLERAYSEAEDLLDDGKAAAAAMAFYALGDFKDARDRCFSVWDRCTPRETLSTGFFSTVGVKKNGTVIAVGNNEYNQCEVSDWSNILCVAAGGALTLGLKENHTVVSTPKYEDWDGDVSGWRDVVCIDAGYFHAVGLRADGTVLATGYNDDGQCRVSEWSDIAIIASGAFHTVGLRTDGTVIATGYNEFGQCDVEDWRDVVALTAGDYLTLGLRSDGRVLVAGRTGGSGLGSGWEGITAAACGCYHAVGLHDDGTVIADGYDIDGQCSVSRWTDIVAVSAGAYYTVGLRSDGTVIATGNNEYGQCDVEDWRDIKVPSGK